MQIVFYGDNLHEMLILFSGKNKNNIINLSNAEFTLNMLCVNHILLSAIFSR